MCKATKNDRNVHSLTPWQGVYIALSTIDSETKKTIGLLEALARKTNPYKFFSLKHCSDSSFKIKDVTTANQSDDKRS